MAIEAELLLTPQFLLCRCRPKASLGRKITGRQDTTAYGAPFRPAHPLQQKRVQFGRRRRSRGCESDPVKSVREQAGPPGGGWPGSTTTRVPT